MRPIFCGNFEYDARQNELERLFRRYGRVERVDMKSGFAFIYMEDERDAEDAIRGLDRTEYGRKGRRLRVEWTRQERAVRKPGGGGGGGSRRSAITKPSKTLFVINFDPYNTRTRDLEKHFDPYGKIVNVRIRRNFAFIQYETQEDATRALEGTNMSKLMDRVISVEYAVRDDDDRRNGYSPDRGRDRSPYGRGRDKGRSPSPYRRERGSPDYGRGRSPSPYRRERASPDYGRPYKRERASPDYGRGPSRSPYKRQRVSPDNGRAPSPPYRRERGVGTPDLARGPSSSPVPYRRGLDKVRDPSRSPPYRRERGSTPDHVRVPSPSPYTRREKVSSPDLDGAPIGGSPYQSEHRRVSSPSTYRGERESPEHEHEPGEVGSPPNHNHGGLSPDSKADLRGESPISDGAGSPPYERSRSRTPASP